MSQSHPPAARSGPRAAGRRSLTLAGTAALVLMATPALAMAAEPSIDGHEDPSQATATTRSFVQDDGSVIQRIYATPVNVQDDHGDWQHIDTDLKPDGTVLQPQTASVPVSIPSGLSDSSAVTVGPNGRRVSLSPVGFSGTAKVAGDTATFTDAADGVDAQLAALAGGVKQTYVLDGADAPDHLDVDLQVSDGLSVRALEDGGAEVVDGDGKVRYELSPTVGWVGDAKTDAKPIKTDIAHEGDGWRVRIDLSAGWIREALKDGKVTIDPTLTAPTPSQDALLRASAPTSTGLSSASGTLGVGDDARSLLQFGAISTIPEDAHVLDATLAAYVESGPTDGDGKDVTVNEVTAPWDGTGTSWNNRTATAAWAAPGGDILASPSATALNVTGSNGWTTWRPTTLAQRWVTGTSKNYGLQLKTATTGGAELVLAGMNATGTFADKKPYIQVRFAPAAGQRRDDTYLTEGLNDRTKMGVGVASGNLLLSSQDISINGVGQPLSLARTYNSGLTNYQTGAFGNGGTSNLSGDVRLVTLAGGDVALHLGDGSVYRFPKAGGAYTPAPRLEADLVRLADNTYELTYRRSRAKWKFRTDGKLSQMVDKSATPNTISLAYTGTGVLQSITDTQGRVLPVTVNANGQITLISDPTGRQWKYTYNGTPANRLATYTDPAGKITRYVYDSSARLKRITTPGGRLTLIDYDADGRVSDYTRVTDVDAESGPTTQLVYDQTNPRCNDVTGGKATIVTDPRGNSTTYCVNDQLEVFRAVDALGHEQATEYNAQGQVKKFTDGVGTGAAVTNNSYATSTNNLTSSATQIGETTAFGQSSQTTGLEQYQPTSETSPDNKSQFFGYDTQGNVTSVRDAQTNPNQQATLTYNLDGTLKDATDGENRKTTYGYYVAADGGTRKGLLKTTAPPAPRVATTLNYDTLGRVTSATDGNSKTTTYTYDKLDRVATTTFSDANSQTNTYDDDGNLTDRSDTYAGQYTYGYDALNRRTQETLPNRSTGYTYDDAGNLTSIADNKGVTGYGYDEVNRGCYVAPNDAGGGSCVSSPSGATKFRYDALGHRTKTIYPNGITVKEAPDASGKTTTITAGTGTNLTTRSYIYAGPTQLGSGKTGQLIASTAIGSLSTAYTYDADARVATVTSKYSTNPADVITYGYDKAGNRLTTSLAAGGSTGTYALAPYAATATYNGANQLATLNRNTKTDGASNRTFSYDGQGNDLRFHYNGRNQTDFADQALGYAGSNQFELVEDDGKLIENNLLGVSTKYSSFNPVDPATSFVRDVNGQLLARKSATGAWSYYVSDAQGSVIGVYDAAGTLTKKYDYDPDGNVWRDSSGKPEDFGYTGSYTKSGSTTLYHNGLRWYDPTTARWTQPDPLDQPDDPANANGYLYAGSNGVNFVDPSGELFGIPSKKDIVKAAEKLIVRYGSTVAELTEKLGEECAFSLLDFVNDPSVLGGAETVALCGKFLIVK